MISLMMISTHLGTTGKANSLILWRGASLRRCFPLSVGTFLGLVKGLCRLCIDEMPCLNEPKEVGMNRTMQSIAESETRLLRISDPQGVHTSRGLNHLITSSGKL